MALGIICLCGVLMMKKFISLEKLSKKKQRKLNKKKRTTWGSLDPTTRKPDNSNAYNRNKRKEMDRREAI